MQQIYVNYEKCNLCKLCIRVCHDYCISVDDENRIVIDSMLCDCCTQCIAICSKQALGLVGGEVRSIGTSLLPKPEQLEELFKARRSIREFQPKKMERELLERIVGMGRYAPTMDKTIEAIIVDDEEKLELLERFNQRHWNRIYTFFFKSRAILAILKCFSSNVEIVKSKLENRDQHLFGAPAVVILVGNRKKDYLSELSAQYYLYNMILYAYSMGLGTILSDAGKIVFSANRAVYKLLGIQKGYRILGVLLIGYPKLQFKNKIDGLEMHLS